MPTPRVLVIGLDGLEPTIVSAMLARGELPALDRLRQAGGYGTVATTLPAQTPVAWSTFATGVNPGGHGIFDFIRRDPKTCLPDFSLNRFEQKNAFLPPKAVNLRRGTPLWELLSAAGVPSVVIRCPCTFPPDDLRGRMLSGMGVPDLRGGLGTSTFLTTRAGVTAGESELVVPLARGAEHSARLIGPRHPRTRADITHPVTIRPLPGQRAVAVVSDGTPAELVVREGEWSDWLRVKFKTGLLQAVSGMVRFHLVALEPELELYASPVNFDPAASLLYPVSGPPEYAAELARAVGTFYTTGMVEDHTGLSNGRFGEGAYLAQCADVMRERERMLLFELARQHEGFVFCLFDTPDRIGHMLWRFREEHHPANQPGEASPELRQALEAHYRECDALVGRVVAQAGPDTLTMVLSDHGFGSFQRGVHLNRWLADHGYLALLPGADAGPEGGELLQQVDWSRTRAYALGLGSVYLNLRGREAQGIVPPDAAPALAAEIAQGLTGLEDRARGAVAVRGASTREEAYRGAWATESPDVVARFARGYRASWATALGGVPGALFEDNVRRWGGDHIVDPELVPGVLFMSQPFRTSGARLLDLAPTILAALGVPAGPAMEGTSLRD